VRPENGLTHHHSRLVRDIKFAFAVNSTAAP
jgi:hypothetical protein